MILQMKATLAQEPPPTRNTCSFCGNWLGCFHLIFLGKNSFFSRDQPKKLYEKLKSLTNGSRVIAGEGGGGGGGKTDLLAAPLDDKVLFL